MIIIFFLFSDYESLSKENVLENNALVRLKTMLAKRSSYSA